MKRIWAVVAVAVIGLAVWAVLLPDDWRNWMGFSSQATDNYAFTSGPGPMLLTALGMSTIIAGLWHAVNCHVDGCPKIGRYHVAGGKFKVCRAHHPEDAVRQRKVSHHHVISLHRSTK